MAYLKALINLINILPKIFEYCSKAYDAYIQWSKNRIEKKHQKKEEERKDAYEVIKRHEGKKMTDEEIEKAKEAFRKAVK